MYCQTNPAHARPRDENEAETKAPNVTILSLERADTEGERLAGAKDQDRHVRFTSQVEEIDFKEIEEVNEKTSWCPDLLKLSIVIVKLFKDYLLNKRNGKANKINLVRAARCKIFVIWAEEPHDTRSSGARDQTFQPTPHSAHLQI